MNRFSLLSLVAMLTVHPSLAGETWHVKEAPIKFTVTLLKPPTHPSAGYFMHLPDGGILPKPFPDPRVVDALGNPLKSCVLWQNPESGAAIVFEAPKAGGVVFVYVTSSAMLNVWTPRSGLTPSAIIATHPGNSSQKDAVDLAKFGSVDATVHYRNEPGSQGATLALPGDRSGRPGKAAMYMLAYLVTTDPGETWIAPVNYGGNMQVSIDRNQLQVHKVSDKQGGTGASLKLTEGLHRLDALGVGTEMLLTWRTPKTPVSELGGVRASDLRFPGTPMWESRQLHSQEIVRSGECAIQRIQSRDGGPVAHFNLEAHHIYRFGDETPILMYGLHAFLAGNPEITQYIWSFSCDPGAFVTGANVSWLFPSLRDQQVTLKVIAGNKQSQCTRPFYPFTDAGSSLNDPSVRAAFRDTCLTMFRSYPSSKDPTAGWDASMWNKLFRTMELVPRNDIVAYMVTNRWDTISKKLQTDRREMIEDMFLTTTAFTDPQMALKWSQLLEQKAPNRTRAIALRLRGAEVLMYQLKNLDEARKWVKPLIAEGSEGAEWAKIRLGDIEFLSRNLNEATQLYGDVQDRVKHGKTGAEVEKPATASLQEQTRAQIEAMKAMSKTPPLSKEKEIVKMPKAPTENAPVLRVAPWKLSAIRDVAAAENVRNLIEQGFTWEAWQALHAWEREFPLSKISSDYLLLEAKFYKTLGDCARCRALLEAYCDQVDASNYVEDAMYMITDCMVAMRESPEAVSKYRALVNKRLEFH